MVWTYTTASGSRSPVFINGVIAHGSRGMNSVELAFSSDVAKRCKLIGEVHCAAEYQAKVHGGCGPGSS